MKASAFLVNVARGRVVDEPALIEALEQGRIAGAAVDCVWEEPLPATSPLWRVNNLLITPHTAGETRRYEDNVIDLLLENLDRLWRGEIALKQEIIRARGLRRSSTRDPSRPRTSRRTASSRHIR